MCAAAIGRFRWRAAGWTILALLAVAPAALAKPKDRDSGGSDSRGRASESSSASRGGGGGQSSIRSRSSERSSSPSTITRQSSGGSPRSYSTRGADSSPRSSNVERSRIVGSDSPRTYSGDRSRGVSGDASKTTILREPRGVAGDNVPSARSRVSSGQGNSSNRGTKSADVKLGESSNSSGGSLNRGSTKVIGSDFGPNNPPPPPSSNQLKGNSASKLGDATNTRRPGSNSRIDNSGRGTANSGKVVAGDSSGTKTKTDGPVLTRPGLTDAVKDSAKDSGRAIKLPEGGRNRLKSSSDLTKDLKLDGKKGESGRSIKPGAVGSGGSKAITGGNAADLGKSKVDRKYRDRLGDNLTSKPIGPVVERDGVKLKDASKAANQRFVAEQTELKKLGGRPAWTTKLEKHPYEKLVVTPKAEKLHLQKQYALHHHGDVARRLNLSVHIGTGGWGHRHVGFVSAGYRTHCFHYHYFGPSWYPSYCWYPVWSPWVHWSWDYYCDPYWDPRPVICRPIVYRPVVARWVYWDYPVWEPLPVVSCGTWVDVPPVVVETGYDVQLLAVRFVDPGHPDKNLGQRVRVWLRNNSRESINRPFNVLVLGSDADKPAEDRLEAGQRIESIEAGQTLAVDVRLPVTADGKPGAPREFAKLHVLVDSDRELNDTNRANNGILVARRDVLPVDPVLFQAEEEMVATGSTITLAGEGLGPEPGEVLLQVGDEQKPVEVVGWYDLGVRVKVPELPLEGATAAQFVVVRGDTAATNPVQVQLVSGEAGQEF